MLTEKDEGFWYINVNDSIKRFAFEIPLILFNTYHM